MSQCIICGTSTDGPICELHEQDVAFIFEGTRPGQLTPGRFYRGTVDGFAEFGVFVDVGDTVTGLLHQSELDQRLETLDWDPGQTVFVEVKNVRDNGNVDLGWSIRQAESSFRGVLIDDPAADTPLLPEDTDDEAATDDASDATDESGDTDETTTEPSSDGGDRDVGATGSADAEGTAVTGAVRSRDSDATAADESAAADTSESASETTDEVKHVDSDTAEPALQRVPIADLRDRLGSTVRIEGEIESARQTAGPTVFELADGTGTVECAAFESAGVRAYPSVEAGDLVRIDGEVRERRGDLQVETEALAVLDGDLREATTERIERAIAERAEPDAVEPLVEGLDVDPDPTAEVAGAIRRAIIEARPVIVRHSATADGYVGAAAIERAALGLIDEHHEAADAVYHNFDRRPIDGTVYSMDDATTDLTRMLEDADRHDEPYPLFVFVGAGGTDESVDGFGLLDVYDAEAIVIDSVADDSVADAVTTTLTPDRSAADLETPALPRGEPTATTLAATVAAHVDDSVRADLQHLPAVAIGRSVPGAALDAATAAGYDERTVREINEAVTLVANYQVYEDKRELVADLLFEADGGLASHVSEQYREKVDRALDTARAHLTETSVAGVAVTVLDVEAFTHRFEFPPVEILLDELYRERDDTDVVLGIDRDSLHLRTEAALDVRTVAERVTEHCPDAGVETASARAQRVEFLAGERDEVREATLAAIGEQLG
ncbi:OB-fold nucleic acid binding domain-containing protein [Halococcoides cellulosivorans]|uniref:DNA-binding protein n=1 Tax=Halococcoides cellulosivorans TaxID=1679096 RepID=A0A2R4X1R7_9EURY|nr:OB-fold nucleic acid binding domain-containing protein [Halococcoides cellulosivorans]AWB27711.1 DNA-binding protein [Halococcoides cellulosivorans]